MKPFVNLGWWVETWRDRPSEWGDDFQFGRALVSPERSPKAGIDNYRFMRDVAQGDICLHLNNHKKVAGISRVVTPFKPTPFEVDGSSGVYVPLSGYHPLKPPLTILTEKHRARLDQLREAANQHGKFFFYTKNLAINMYLTPVSQDLLDLLDDAYSDATGMKISNMV